MEQTQTKTISTGYNPRPLQSELHKSFRRSNVVVCHRRFGKTVLAINEMIDQGLRMAAKRDPERPRPRYAYIAPTYGQAKRIAWDYLKTYTSQLPGFSANEAELRVDIQLFPDDPTNTLRFMLLGAENPSSLKGIYLDGCILDEFGEMLPRTWTEAVSPTLRDRKGWVIFIGTPKGRNHFYELHEYAKTSPQKWFTKIYRASDSGIIDQEELEEARRIMSEDEFAQEFECSFNGSTQGSYYGSEMSAARREGRIRNVPYDPAIPVHTAWDLGISDETAIFFYQRVFKEIHIVEYCEYSGFGLPAIVKELQAKPYVYGTDFLPHDANARELGTGKTRVETLRTLGRRDMVVAKRQSVEDGIAAVRTMLSRCYFDEVKAHRGIVCLEEYRKKFDEKLQTYTKPLHDQYSHGADAFRTMAMTLDMEAGSRENLVEEADWDYDPYNKGA